MSEFTNSGSLVHSVVHQAQHAADLIINEFETKHFTAECFWTSMVP